MQTGILTLTQADHGDRVTMTVGEQLAVVLTSPGMMRWDRPTVQGDAVALVSASGGYPGSSPARAVFRAVALGSAAITASTDAPCEHQTPRCLLADQLWMVTIVVQPGDPDPPAQLNASSLPSPRVQKPRAMRD
jgi:hypothetical protein